MKLLNANAFDVKVGDHLEYVHEAVEWLNNYHRKRGNPTFPSASELNERNPIVTKIEYTGEDEVNIFLWVYHDICYTGMTGVVHGTKVDLWALYSDGTFDSRCSYPIFRKK